MTVGGRTGWSRDAGQLIAGGGASRGGPSVGAGAGAYGCGGRAVGYVLARVWGRPRVRGCQAAGVWVYMYMCGDVAWRGVGTWSRISVAELARLSAASFHVCLHASNAALVFEAHSKISTLS